MLERLQSWNNHGFTIVLFPSNNYFIFLLIDGSLKDLPNGKTRLVVKKVKNLSNCITFEMIKNNFENFVRYNLNYIFIKKTSKYSFTIKNSRIFSYSKSFIISHNHLSFENISLVANYFFSPVPNNPFSFSQSQKWIFANRNNKSAIPPFNGSNAAYLRRLSRNRFVANPPPPTPLSLERG